MVQPGYPCPVSTSRIPEKLHSSSQGANPAAMVWGKRIPLLSAALQTRLTAALGHCKYTYGCLLSTQVCSHPKPMLGCTGISKKHSSLLSDALQTKLAAGLCHCKYTYGDLLSTQVCSHQTPMHWNWQKALLTAECCSANQTDSSLVSLQLHLWRFGLHTGVQ